MKGLGRSALIALLLLPTGSAWASILEAWAGVQQALLVQDEAELEERLGLLREEARAVGVERMTPYAAALAAWASRHPGKLGEIARSAAEDLDPRLPLSAMLAAQWRWSEGAYLRAAGWYLNGVARFVRYERTQRALLIATGLWLLAAFAVASLVAMAVVVLGCLNRLWSDAVRLGDSMLRRANAVVFAVVLVALPLFGGFGPVWWLVYLFALTWCYFDVKGRVVAAVTTFLLAAVVPAAMLWQASLLRWPPVTERVAGMLEDRRVDLSTLRELADAEEAFRGQAKGHLILGELLRMHGESSRARLQFQLAATADARDPRPNVFLGNLAMEDGDVTRAVGLYTAATNVDPSFALAYHNLSSAYDQSRRFMEGDGARQRARQLAGQSTDQLGVGGSESRLRYPRLGRSDVRRFEQEMTPVQRAELGLDRRAPELRTLLLRREPLLFLVCGTLGCLVLWLRLRWLPVSRSCPKCGNVYHHAAGGGDAQNLCSQCVSVFLRRDLVSIEQQTNKMRQVRRWETREVLRRRLVAVLAPGSARLLAGQVSLGMLSGLVAWALLLGGLVWAPRLFAAAEPAASALPVQALLLALWLVVWGRSVAVAWYRR